MLEKIKDFFKKEKQNTSTSTNDFNVRVIETLVQKTTANLDVYESPIFGCVSKIANNAQKIKPWVSYEVEPDVYEYKADHWLNKIIENPNQFNNSWESLINQAIFSFYQTGNIYFFKDLSLNGKEIEQIVLLNSNNVELYFENDKLKGLYYDIDSNRKFYPMESIIHIKDLANVPYKPGEQYYIGTPTYLNSVRNLLSIKNEIYAFYDRLLRSDAKDVLLISKQDSFEQQEIEDITSRLKQIYGRDGAKNSLTLGNGASMSTIKRNANFGQNLFGGSPNETIVREVCAVFGVPFPIYNGEFSGVTNNSSIMLNSFYDSVNLLMSKIIKIIENDLKKYDPLICLKYEELKYISEEEKQFLYNTIFERGQISINALNGLMGLDPIETDRIIVNANMVPVEQADVVEPVDVKQLINYKIKNTQFLKEIEDEIFLNIIDLINSVRTKTSSDIMFFDFNKIVSNNLSFDFYKHVNNEIKKMFIAVIEKQNTNDMRKLIDSIKTNLSNLIEQIIQKEINL